MKKYTKDKIVTANHTIYLSQSELLELIQAINDGIAWHEYKAFQYQAELVPYVKEMILKRQEMLKVLKED